ncbi:hypothetical protein K3757_14915 [Sulfitobacter sp. S223]|uniref:hypothetical protein n=1 Tax=Sulfitobacter sp. S223 TaxID=2867023 RepID=UPI0021A2952D|nr:hypothetical protein [Sulfitobacter sp. S223]UWR25735.1 hypothetical protein K3757_14915 [Sulfitobacter sp. S223]
MQNLSSVGGFGLGDLLQKFIGGIDSISFDDVSKMALADLDQLLDFDVSEFPPELAATVMGAAEEMKEKARKAQYDLTEQLNRENDIRLQQLDTARINNFVGTGAVDQIIEAENFHEGTSVMVEEFLKQPPRIPSKRADAHLGSPSWEQVYRLAQLLFLLSVVRVFGTNGGLI